ncbi:hypothetical protein J6590_054820 [Homalodisca vitripennis]|nr:hypothetical protein J6590_054820 [Homalodisca vitripennis]
MPWGPQTEGVPILRQRSKSSVLVDNMITESRRPFSLVLSKAATISTLMASGICKQDFLVTNLSSDLITGKNQEQITSFPGHPHTVGR